MAPGMAAPVRVQGVLGVAAPVQSPVRLHPVAAPDRAVCRDRARLVAVPGTKATQVAYLFRVVPGAVVVEVGRADDRVGSPEAVGMASPGRVVWTGFEAAEGLEVS